MLYVSVPMVASLILYYFAPQMYEKSFNMFVQHAILTTAGKFSADKNCTPESRIYMAFKNILSP